MRLGKYIFTLVVSFFAFVSFGFVTSDGKISCSFSNGRASCVALSDDVDTDCMRRIESLLTITAQIDDSAYFVNLVNGFNRDDAVAGRDALSNISPDYSEETDYQISKNAFDNIVYDCDVISNRVVSLRSANLSTRDVIASFSCASCDDSNMSCCCCSNSIYYADFSNQLTNLLNVSLSLSNDVSVIVNLLTGIRDYLGGTVGTTTPYTLGYYMRSRVGASGGIPSSVFSSSAITATSSRNVIGLLDRIQRLVIDYGSSINNYLYYISQLQLSSISNHIEHLDNEFTEFSFFVKERSPLYGNESPEEGYYSYLTNFYLDVAFDRVPSSETRTNWFSRIETLLASLVFADAPGNQLQEDTSTENAVDRIGDSLTSLNDAPVSQLSTFEDASRSVVDSIHSFSSVITDITKPSTIVLVRQSSNSYGGGSSRNVSSGGDFTIEFQSSEIDSLIEACRCVTTLAWTFGGLFLAYWFIHWCLMTSYRLVVFCYSVLSSIFGRS